MYICIYIYIYIYIYPHQNGSLNGILATKAVAECGSLGVATRETGGICIYIYIYICIIHTHTYNYIHINIYIYVYIGSPFEGARSHCARVPTSVTLAGRARSEACMYVCM